MEINKVTLKQFRADFATAVADLEKQYSVKVQLGNISYTDDEFHGKMTVTVPLSAAAAADKARSEYAKYAGMLGLPADSFGAVVRFKDQALKIVGVKLTSRSAKVLLTDVRTGMPYKADVEVIQMKLKKG